jgi:putative ABC transport system permease protein
VKFSPRWFVRLPRRTTSQIERDFEEELFFHYDMRVRELIGQGMDTERARELAQREFGDIDDARRYVRAVDRSAEAVTRRRETMRSLDLEVRDAWRRLRRAPLATATTILTLAVAIGACALVGNIVWGVLLRPLPYTQPDHVVMIWGHIPRADGGDPRAPVAGPYFSLIRGETHTLASVAAFRAGAFNLGGGAEPERLDGIEATGEFFDAIGVAPAVGHFFSREHETSGSERVVVLSHELWRDRFGARADIVGLPVTLNAEPYTVIGVASPGFAFPRGAEMPGTVRLPPRPRIWVPLIPPTDLGFDLALVARLRPGVSLAAAADDLDRIRAIQDRLAPAAKGYFGTRAVPLQEQVTGDTRATMLSLVGAVGLLLFLACVNTAQLQLARLQARRPELAVRAALGASSGRIVAGLMIETLYVIVVAGTIGTLLAWAGMRLVRVYGSWRFPRLADAPFDARAVAVVLVATALAALVASLLSNRVGARIPLVEALRRGGRGSRSAGAPARARRSLIVAQLTLCVVLVSSAGLLIRSLSRQLRSAAGFVIANALTFELTLPEATYPEGPPITIRRHPAAVSFYGELLRRVRDLPQVEAAGLGKPLPLSGTSEGGTYWAEGAPAPRSPTDNPLAGYVVGSPGLLQALGTPLHAGRDFDERDTEDAPMVVIVNQVLADRHWRGEDPIGKRIKLGGYGSPAPWMTIIGVSANVKRKALDQLANAEMTVPYTQKPYPSFLSMQFVVRSSAAPSGLLPHLRRVIAELDRTVPISNVRTLDALVGETTAQARFSAGFMTAFGGVALALAMIGVYGVVAFSVSQRRQEFGVRRALGAGRSNIIGLVAREGLALAAVGLGVGLALSLLAGQLMRQLLYEVGAFDLPTLVSTIAVLALATAGACLVPAVTASRVEPRTVLEEG